MLNEEEEFNSINVFEGKISEYERLKQKWSEFWPQRGNQQRWDAAGKIIFNSKEEFFVVKAKANEEEIETECKAKDSKSKEQICKAIDMKIIDLKLTLSPEQREMWVNKYYQYANRLAFLSFCKYNGIMVNLLNIYFIGDKISGKTCPSSKFQWEKLIGNMRGSMGLSSIVLPNVFNLYLPINPNK